MINYLLIIKAVVMLNIYFHLNHHVLRPDFILS